MNLQTLSETTKTTDPRVYLDRQQKVSSELGVDKPNILVKQTLKWCSCELLKDAEVIPIYNNGKKLPVKSTDPYLVSMF